ncbi:MAG: shikimate kinase [Flavobacteriales bacterium]|nr:shikimate kinase [Flavobacteriales bacterium]
MKIFLIGFMGSGKTSVGKRLAKSLDIEFIDLDKHIELRAGKSINDIFRDLGETKFRELEREALADLKGKSKCVIATGGGTPCFHDNIQFMNAGGKTVYLELTGDQLLKRLAKSRSKRPLLKDLTDKELKVFIEEKLKERASSYLEAQHRVDASHVTNTAHRILQLVKSN